MIDSHFAETHRDLLRARYPKMDDPAFYYHILCDLLRGEHDVVAWEKLSEEQWNALIMMARREQISAILYWLWKSDRPHGIPKATFLQFSATFLANKYRHNQIYRELKERILPALAGSVSPVVLLKGSALAYTMYPHPALRPMGDVDLLVHQDQLSEAVERLVAIGFFNPTKALGEMTGGMAHHVHLVATHPSYTVGRRGTSKCPGIKFRSLLDARHRLVLGKPGAGGGQ